MAQFWSAVLWFVKDGTGLARNLHLKESQIINPRFRITEVFANAASNQLLALLSAAVRFCFDTSLVLCKN